MDQPTYQNEDEQFEKSLPYANGKHEEKESLFAELEETQIEIKPYFFFCMMYCFNAIFVLPFFITQMCFKIIRDMVQRLRHCEFFQAIKVFIYYSIDILMAVSVLAMYPLAFYPTPKNAPLNYQYWAITCLIFLQSFLLLQSYMMTLNDDMEFETFKHFALTLISEDNMNQLGLGRLAKQMEILEEPRSEVIGKLKAEFVDVVSKSLEEENIDPTLFYFTLETDAGLVQINELKDLTSERIKKLIEKAKKQLLQQNILLSYSQELGADELSELNNRNEVLKLIRTQGFRGMRHIIDNLLWPQYQYVKLMQHFSDWKMMLIVIFVLLLKLSWPLYAVITDPVSARGTKIEVIIISCFAGMYLNMISILVDLIINEDLKGRRYILNVLETLIQQNRAEDDQFDDDSFQHADHEELPVNTLYKLDLSCNLSLESWDNARRLTLTFDQRNQDMYETTFSFLALYWFYMYIILSQDLLDIDLVPALHFFFSSPIQEWNMLMDFFLVTILFLIRVNQGSIYNETFEHLSESIGRIASVYEDKKSLFDFYFSPMILFTIENDLYRNITHRIYCTAAEKVLFQQAQRNSAKPINPTKFRSMVSDKAKERVTQLCATMEKLVSQISFDSEHFCHCFLGLFKSDMAKVFSTIAFMAYIFFHRRIKKYLKEQEALDHHHQDG